jgi:autotransporter-associated beta strand protein
MTDFTRCLSMRRIVLVASTSAAAMSVVIAAPAAAQCAPDPTVPGGTTTCSGLDADGLIVTSSSSVVVAGGATVLKGAGTEGAIALSSPSSVTTIVALTNNGTISATDGVALAAQDRPDRVGFSTITNAAGATISGANGAMNVWFGRLTNAGTIDGGAGSAIALPSTGSVIGLDGIFNSGSILSNSSAPTIALTVTAPQLFSNSGTIANTGSGLAIDAGDRSLHLVIAQGGVVSAAGPVALSSRFQVSLTNAGTINGGIVGGSGFDDRIDTRSGVINGSVTLNGGNDLLVARLGANTLVENVTGLIDGGAGTDVLELFAGQDRVLTSSALPTGFEVLQLDIANNATVTLAAQPPAGGYYVRGTGLLFVGNDLTTSGPAISPSYIRQNVGFEYLNFSNPQAINATLAQDFDYAVRLESVASALNSGSIQATGGSGLAIQNATSETVTINTGAITATSTGASISGVLQNIGFIRSLTGTAVSNDLGGGGVRSRTSANTGTIDGVTIGYALGALVLNNSGRIIASDGVGVLMSSAALNNLNAGTISGTQASVRTDGFNPSYIANAGTLNGDVDFGTTYSNMSSDWFIDRGGVVNGNVLMGGGEDVFLTDLTRPSGGIAGTIDGGSGFDVYRYRTNVDAQAVVTPRATFEGVGYEVAESARLMLTSPTAVLVPVTFTGQGTIDMTADLNGLGNPLIDATKASLPGYSGVGENLPTNHLTIVSRGTLSYGGGFAPAFAMVQGTVESDFENAGTITTGPTTLAALRQWDTVTNSGTILLNGNTAVTNVNSVVNTGGITTSSGASASYGILEAERVDNSGTISVRNFAIYNVGSVINSGLIASSDDAAIGGRGFGTSFSVPPIIDNRAGGTISGSAATGAIRVTGGMLTNAGAIVGSVDLGYTGGERAYDGGIYLANGGTITGNLLFGSGQDTLVVTRTGTGVSGTIDGGLGSDTVALDKTTDGAATFAGPLDFERLEVRNGAWTLSGAQSYSDGASIATGASLTASTSAFGDEVANNGTLTFAQASDATFGNTLTGNGTLIKQGIGTLALAGNSSAFAGTTTVQAGSLALNGALGGQIEVSSGARLTGTGQGTGTVSILAGGTLAGRSGQVLTIGRLNLVQGSTIEAALGTPSGTGLFKVNGNVVLDGSLNVVDAGRYGVGVYRLIDYTGTLTDNGLDVASQPQASTSSATVQTSLANQVNLVVNPVGGSGAVQFWDGIGTTADGAVGGGSGTWNTGSGTNWTNAQGTANSRWASAFAVFQNNGGTVTVDSSGVASQGMQFASDGYRVTGGPVALVGAATMRVGDGSAAGSGWNATIDSVLSGAGSLVKQDLGTLTLTAANTYTGGTTVNAGTLRITGSVSGNITNNASLIFDRSSDLAFAGAISGNGTLTKAGTATLALGAQTYTGATRVQAGTLALTGTLASSAYEVATGAKITSGESATIATTAADVSVLNSGTIANTRSDGRAINLAGSNNARTIRVVNNAGATITSAEDAVRLNFNPTGSSIRVDNYGTIQTTGGGQALDFDAAKSGGATIVINNYQGGQLLSVGQDAIRPGQGAVVTNAGLIRSEGAANNSYDGIDWQQNAGVMINTATGTISGLRHGITSDANVDVTNAGTILGRNGSGVGSDGSGKIVNTGSITGQWDGVATNGDGDGIDIDFVGTIMNSGTIQGLSATGVDSGGRPNSAEGVAMGGGSVTNNAGATIFGAGTGVLINHDANPGGVADAATTITNAGNIRGGAGRAITLVGEFADTITNSGTVNGGTLGAIDMGGGDDTLVLSGGSAITGTVDGGAGIDRVQLIGTGNGSFAGAVNFERLDAISGNWTLTGASTYSSGTGIAAAASLTGNAATLTGSIANAGTLVFAQANDGTVGATITGTGLLSKTGTGTLTIGSQTSFTGRVSVDAGRLVMAGALPAAVTVNRGGTLGGVGTLTSLTVASGGTVAPGNSPGTITVTGAFVQAAGSTYAAETTAAGLSDRIAVGGTVTIGNGAVLRVSRGNGTYTLGTRYTLLTAGGGIVGTYTLEQTAAGGTEFRLVQSANGVAVDVARTGASFAGIAATDNQAAAAGAFGDLGITNAAYAALTLEPNDAAVRAGLDQLSGEIHGTVRTTMLHGAQTGEDVARLRLLGPKAGRGLWFQMTGQSGEDDGDGNAAPARRRGWGAFGGIEAPVGAAARIGIAGGYTHTDLTAKRGLGSADVETWQALAYAGGTLGPVALRAGTGYAWAKNEVERRVAFSGFSASALSDYDGSVLHGFAEAGIPLPALGGTVEPFAGIEAYRVKSDAFVESSSAVALAGLGRSETFTLGTLGLRAETPIAQGLSARTRIGWQRALGDRSPSAVLQFAAAGPQFEVSGTPLSRDAVLLGLELAWQPSERTVVTAGYAGNIGDAGSDNRLRAALSIGF